MNRRQEICRHFLRGSCRFGARCNYLHTVEQQAEPNPHGFGVKAAPQTRGGVTFGAKNQSPQKPFENKWNRFSVLNSASTTAPRQSDTQQQGSTHTCTDPAKCKERIIDDHKNEKPLWKLTCYGHWMYLPCDVPGDVSCEELRAAAYDDAHKGLPLQLIVERERNLLKNRMEEFENFIQKPYVIPQSRGSGASNLFPGTTSNASLSEFRNNLPFPGSQVGITNSGSLGSNAFGQSVPSSSSLQPSGFNISSTATGPFGTQSPSQPFGSASNFAASSPFSLISSASTLPNNGPNIGSALTFAASSPSSLISSAPPLVNNGPTISSNGFFSSSQASLNSSSSWNQDKTTVPKDMSIWFKEEWEVGEVPEEEPPPNVIRH